MLLLEILMIVIALDFAALRWGVDSRDNQHSSEWLNRWRRGFFL